MCGWDRLSLWFIVLWIKRLISQKNIHVNGRKGVWNTGMPHSSKVQFMPLYFYKRTTLVSLFTNGKESKEDFSFYEKKLIASFLYIISTNENFHWNPLLSDSWGKLCYFFSKKEGKIITSIFRK